MQTRKQSALEAVTNVLIGYTVAIISQLIIFPVFDIEVTFSENLAIGAYFTIVSLIRSYTLRRIYNRAHSTRY